MAKLTDINIVVIQDGEKIQFKTPVNVTKTGLFTTTLPAEAVKQISTYGAELVRNRVGTPGYFEDKTLKGIQQQIEDFVREAMSRELVEDRLVIKYRVRTRAAYVVDEDGEIIPNGYWCKDRKSFEHKGAKWHEGNDNYAGNNFTPSLAVYAMPFHKKRYTYKSGKEYTTYEPYFARCKRSESSVDWLASQVHVIPNDRWGSSQDLDNLPEIDATEENAVIFVKMIGLIDTANEWFAGLNEPDTLLEFVKKYTIPSLPGLKTDIIKKD